MEGAQQHVHHQPLGSMRALLVQICTYKYLYCTTVSTCNYKSYGVENHKYDLLYCRKIILLFAVRSATVLPVIVLYRLLLRLRQSSLWPTCRLLVLVYRSTHEFLQVQRTRNKICFNFIPRPSFRGTSRTSSCCD